MNKRLWNPLLGSTARAVLAVAVMVWLVITAADAQPRLKSVESLVVVDATGKKVGEVIETGFENLAEVAFEVDGLVFTLFTRPDGLFFSGTYILYFESTDCTGTPLISPDPGGLLQVAAVGPPGMTVYGPDSSATPQTITTRSSINRFTGACIDDLDIARNMVPALPLIDLDPLFTPPFKVKVAKGKIVK
jgi:hypothetical protein